MRRAFLHNEERIFFFVFLWFQLTSLYPVTHCPSLIKLVPVRDSSPWGRLGGVIPFGEGAGVRLLLQQTLPKDSVLDVLLMLEDKACHDCTKDGC